MLLAAQMYADHHLEICFLIIIVQCNGDDVPLLIKLTISHDSQGPSKWVLEADQEVSADKIKYNYFLLMVV